MNNIGLLYFGHHNVYSCEMDDYTKRLMEFYDKDFILIELIKRLNQIEDILSTIQNISTTTDLYSMIKVSNFTRNDDIFSIGVFYISDIKYCKNIGIVCTIKSRNIDCQISGYYDILLYDDEYDGDKHEMVKKIISMKNADFANLHPYTDKVLGEKELFNYHKTGRYCPNSQVAYTTFCAMQRTFDWYQIKDLIQNHSICGAAYINAVRMKSIYKSGKIIKIEEPSYIEFVHCFNKMIYRMRCKGYKINDDGIR